MVGHRQFHRLSDVVLVELSDHHSKIPHKTLDMISTQIPDKFDGIHVGHDGNDVIVLGESNDCKEKGNITNLLGKNVLIDVKDEKSCEIVVDDDDCVFVKKEKNLVPRGNNKGDPICVDDYVNVNLEKVLKPEKNCLNVEKGSIVVDRMVHYVDDDEVMIVSETPCFRKRMSLFSGISIREVGESSRSKGNDMVIEIDDDLVEKEVEVTMFLCEICADSKPEKESFRIKGCTHSYCSDCMKNYVASKLQDGVSRINCPVPGCGGVLEPEYCREILPFEVFVRWGDLLCESVILASQKFYCPFKDCSALLIDDGDESVTQSECPSCFRLFCAQCQVAWHEGVVCAEFKSLNKDEREKEGIMLRKLAKNQNWQRCPACKYYVEKSEGCLYMKCRCGIAFCYSCGAVNEDQYHYCKKCGR